MTQNSTKAGNRSNREPNPPALVAWHVSERGRGRKFWTRLGAAWGHKEGEGITLFLDVVPVGFDGRIVLLPPKAEDAKGGGGQRDEGDAAVETGEVGAP
jgi:hypothetical protein